MSKREVIASIQKTRANYDHNSAIHVNCIRIGKGECLEHALTKFMLGWILINGGDIRIVYDSVMKNYIKDFSEVPIKTDWLFKGSERHFLTEAIIKNRKEKHDFVVLESGEVIEVVKSSDPPREELVKRIRL